MPPPMPLLLLPIPLLAGAGIMYYHHRRLTYLYPTLRVPAALEISARRDRPAFGMTGLNDPHRRSKQDPNFDSNGGGERESWLRTDGGDMWTATVPRRLLASSDQDATSLIVFARAFWGSWPLQLERHIVSACARIGVLFQLRFGAQGRSAEEEHRFAPGARVLGGLFIVEAHDSEKSTNTHGPLVTSWWLRPVQRPARNGLLGGYHSFVVEDIPPTEGNQEPAVRVSFISHMVLSPAVESSAAGTPPSAPTLERRGMTLKQRVLMHFHVFYARVLLDLAVRGLESGHGCK